MPGEKSKKIMSDMVVNRTPSKVPERKVVPVVKKRYEEPQESRSKYQEPNVAPTHPRPAATDARSARIEFRNERNSPSGRGGTEHEYDFDRPRRPYFLWIISAACIIALIIGIGGLFAHATVMLEAKAFSGDVNATVNFSQGHESGTVFFATATKTFTDEIVVTPTGSVEKESKATGKVRLYNSNTTSKSIPAGTRILSSKNIEYQTAKSVTVGAKKGTTPGSVEVGVLAVEVGAQGNTEPDDFTFVDEKKFANITIKSSAAITGGARASDAIADPVEIAAATETLKGRFADPSVLVARMGEGIPDDFIVLPISITASAPSITAETSHSDGVHVVASQTVGMIMAKKSDIARAIGNQLNADKAIPLTIDTFTGLTFITSTPMSPTSIPNQFSARMSGATTIFGDIDTTTIPQQIAGKSRADVKKLFDAHPEIQSSKVRMIPPWRRVLPVSVNDIDITKK